MKIHKKGFTLVELLAVIIVLIIIIFIAINKIRESNLKAQLNAMKANAGIYIKAVNELAGVDNLTSDRMYSGTFGKYMLEDYGLKLSGTAPDLASVTLNDFEVESACLSYGKYKVIFKNGKLEDPVVGTCDSGDKTSFAYTGTEQVYTVEYDGYYKVEAWGAQGGDSRYIYNSDNSNTGGYGGYSSGEIYLEKGDKLYINVGGKGNSVTYNQSTGEVVYDNSYGYNGGGYAVYHPSNSAYAAGGGASSVATVSGLLKNLSENRDPIILVAGGGGGAGTHSAYPSYSGDGGSGGGFKGAPGNPSNNTCYQYSTGATQDGIGSYTACSSDGRTNRGDTPTPNAGFGLGGNYTANTSSRVYSGGGAGYYGAYSSFHGPSGGGSGYIANPDLTNKVMYCYNCPTSNSLETKTISNKCVDDDPKGKCSKKGNGYVIVSLIKKETKAKSDEFKTKFSDYDKLAYIKSDGNQYIDTLVPAANNVGIKARLSSQDVTNDKIFFGSRNSTDSRLWVGNVSSKFYIGWNGFVYSNTTTASSIHNVKLNYLNDRKSYDDDNNVHSSLAELADNSYNIYIFAANNAGTASYNSKITLYELEITSGDSLIRKFVPCKSKTDATQIGLCDLITGQFYGNSGTGSFTT